MRRSMFAAAAMALLAAAGPAAAYSTRYEVRHYPAAFTRTVNQALGTNVESYPDGSVTLGYGTTPAPSLSVVATETGTVGFDIDSSYEFAVALKPLTAAAQAQFIELGQHPTHAKIGEATGLIMLTAPKVSGTRLTADVSQPAGTGFDVGCQDGIGCTTTHYHTALFLDADADNPYHCLTASCPPVAPGTAITLRYSMTAHVQVYGGPGSTASLLIDPVITLDPDFLHDNGLTVRDFAITPEAGFGNSGGTGAVPEPVIWGMMLAGFGIIGSALRCRRAAVVA